MSLTRPSAVEIYAFRRWRGRLQFLILRRSPRSRLPGIWQPITGKIRRAERAEAAARRELREETGLAPRRWYCLETMTSYFEPRRDRFQFLVLFAVEVDSNSQVRLSREHDRLRWTSAKEAARLFLWESQRRGLAAVRQEILRSRALARALELRA